MSRQTALWQYAMAPKLLTGLEGRKPFRQVPGPSFLRWLRRQLVV